MNTKIRRIVSLAVKNLSKLALFILAALVYMYGSLMASFALTGNPYFGFAAIFLPLLVYAVWDHSKTQIEIEMRKEQDLIDLLSKRHEG